MNKIFFDIGNSYVKWATLIDGDYQYFKSMKMEFLLYEGFKALHLSANIDEVYFSSVGQAEQIDDFKSFIHEELNILPIQLTSQKSCCGLQSGYEDFSSLGDDRWLAMLGTVEGYTKPVIVIDAGTALTIDAIVDSKHQGGFIVPGLNTMRKSLFVETANLKDVAKHENDNNQENRSHNLLAVETTAAIMGGTLYMAAAFVNRVILDLNHQLQTQFKVVVTGGEAKQLTTLLDSDYDYIPDLVLQGMVFVVESVKKA